MSTPTPGPDPGPGGYPLLAISIVLVVLFICAASWLAWHLYLRRQAKDRRRRDARERYLQQTEPWNYDDDWEHRDRPPPPGASP